MAKLSILPGSTSEILYLFIQDSSVTTGAGLTGLVYNSAGLTAYYVRPAAAAASITLATQTVTGAYSSGGFVEVDSTNMPGVYRFDVPNAVIASGVRSVVVELKGATNMVPCTLEIDLNTEVNVTHVSGTSQTANDNGADINAILVDTATTIPGLIGTPASSVSEDIAGVQSDTTAILADTATLTRSTVMNSTTIATLASQTSFTLTAGSADDGAYGSRAIIVVTDSATATQKAVGVMDTYTGATKTVALVRDPGIFTMAVGDYVDIIPSPAEHCADEVYTGATHNVIDSQAKRIRDLQEYGTYSGGAIFIDTVNGTAGTTDYENGTFLFPVDSIADANTIATSLNLARFRITPGSSITFAATQSGEVFHAHGSTIALGGQDISDTHIIGAIVSGTATATGSPTFDGCTIGTVNLPTSYIENSFLNGTLTLGEAGNYNFVNSHGEGLTGCTVDFGAAIGNNTLTFCNWSGVLELQNMGQTGTDAAGIGGCGIITINANCTGGTLYLIGNFSVTDNSGGAVTIVYSDIETTANATLVDTNELQTDWTNGGRLDLLLDSLITEMATSTAEPGQGTPGASATRGQKIDYLYKAWRNKSTQTSTTYSLYDDAGTTVDQKSTDSDDGTTATKGEIGTGP